MSMSFPAVADVQSRIAAIQSRFGFLAGPSVVPPSSDSVSDSSAALATTGDFGTDLSAATDALALGGTSPTATATTSGASVGQRAADLATGYVGVPYVWGGTDPRTGLDCSGLVQVVYRQLGVPLPRVAADQARAGVAVPSLAAARPGDLLFFDNGTKQPGIDHVGIYLGDNRMVQAPRPGKNVDVVTVPSGVLAIRRVTSDASGSAASRGGGVVQQAASVPAWASATSSAAGLPAAAATYAASFRAASAATGVPVQLLTAVAQAESGFRPDAVSPAGAQGLMQLMPATAQALGVDPMQPDQAIAGAARLLASLQKEFGGRTDLALAAYNAGSAAVKQAGGIPPYPETQAYVSKVLSLAGRSSA
ncbi:MAG TPA: transglycosylase SLT domain-containing protein [Motilibacteraceae bacterium]|nr:transglycosylase SLT domain-containing protein [Motilibacteraceae bacterium]